MTAFVYIAAALAEIAGCFAFWAWLRLDKSVWWLGGNYILDLANLRALNRRGDVNAV